MNLICTRHYEPSDNCQSCQVLCVNCGHANESHHVEIDPESDDYYPGRLPCFMSWDDDPGPAPLLVFDNEGFCKCTDFKDRLSE